MTKEMPKNNNLSLEMMYQTAGTQINLDYSNEKILLIFLKFQAILSHCLLLFLQIHQLKKTNLVNFCLTDHMFGKILQEEVFQKYF